MRRPSLYLASLALAPLALAQSPLTPVDSLGVTPPAFGFDGFGSSLSAEGDWLVVGDRTEAIGLPGAVTLFRRQVGTAYELTTTFNGTFGMDGFGRAIAVEAETASPLVLVGIPEDSAQGPGAGRAVLLQLSGGVLQQVFNFTLGTPQDQSALGAAVAIDDEAYAVGRPDAAGGRVFLWTGPVGSIQAQAAIEPNNLQTGDEFGASVALDNGLLAAGAPNGDSTAGGVDGGVVYLYEQVFVGGAFLPVCAGNPGSCPTPTPIVGAEVQPGDRFGASVDIEGDVIVVGAPGDGSGAAYVFRIQPDRSVVQEARLAPSGQPLSAQFGATVSIDNGRIVVGAPGAMVLNESTGGAFTYVEAEAPPGTWVAEFELGAPQLGSGSSLGLSVGVAGDVVFVGAPNADSIGNNDGVVALYNVQSETCLQDFLGSMTLSAKDRFGIAVAADAATAVVGSPFDNGPVTTPSSSDAGSVAIFELQGGLWFPQKELLLPPGVPGQAGGSSVAIFGDRIVVGAPGDPLNRFATGQAFTSTRSGPGQDFDELVPVDADSGLPGERYGAAVAANLDFALVGAPRANGDVGAVDVLQWGASGASATSWQQLRAPLGVGSTRFGSALAAGGERLAVGAIGDASLAVNGGGVTVYRQRPISTSSARATGGGDPILGGLLGMDSAFGGADAVVGEDFDQNGVRDLFVGAWKSDGVTTRSGDVLRLLIGPDGEVIGSASLTRDLSPGIDWGPVASDDRFGFSLEFGDFDGDGQEELAIGAPGNDSQGGGTPFDRGLVYIVDFDGTGNVSQVTGFGNDNIGGNGIGNGANYSQSLANIGDVDGNGADDLAVGSPFESTGGVARGVVHVLLMAQSTPPAVLQSERYDLPDLFLTAGSGLPFGPPDGQARFGWDLDSDFDPQSGLATRLFVTDILDEDFVDGSRGAVYTLAIGSVAFGADLESQGDLGVDVLSGLSVFGDNTEGLAIGSEDGGEFGRKVGYCGDVNGDGVGDLVVTEMRADDADTGIVDAGRAWVVLMAADGSAQEAYPITALEEPFLDDSPSIDFFGWSFEWLGDHDGDAVNEVLIGFGPETGFGGFFIAEVGEGFVLEDPLVLPSTGDAEARFGSSLAFVGDSLAVGAPFEGAGGSVTGRVRVFEPSPAGYVETQVLTGSAPVDGAAFGASLAGRGNDDLFVGAPAGVFGSNVDGRVHRFERASVGQAFVETSVLDDDAFGADADRYGASLAAVGSSLLVGAPDSDLAGDDSGTVYVYSLTGDCSAPLATADFISVSAGGTQQILVAPGSEFVGQPYLTLYGFQSAPTPLAPGVVFALNPFEPLVQISLANANSAPFVNSFGFLGVEGEAVTQLVLPPGAGASLIGSTIFSGSLVLSLPFLTPVAATEATSVQFVP